MEKYTREYLNTIQNTIINDDCLNIMKKIPDKYFKLVLTDPPYGINIDKWDKKTPSQEYFDELIRISEYQIIFGGNYFTDKLQISKCWLVWNKVGNIQFNNPFSPFELLWTSFYRQQPKIYTFIQQGFINQDKFERIHSTQKPVVLIKMILNDFSQEGDLIFDGFSGSGSIAIACADLKRNFISVEKDKNFYDLSCDRLKKFQSQLMFNF